MHTHIYDIMSIALSFKLPIGDCNILWNFSIFFNQCYFVNRILFVSYKMISMYVFIKKYYVVAVSIILGIYLSY